MKMGQGCGLRLRQSLGVELMSVYMESGENGEGVSPEGDEEMRLCLSVRAGWAQRPRWRGCWTGEMIEGVRCCVAVTAVNCARSDL